MLMGRLRWLQSLDLNVVINIVVLASSSLSINNFCMVECVLILLLHFFQRESGRRKNVDDLWACVFHLMGNLLLQMLITEFLGLTLITVCFSYLRILYSTFLLYDLHFRSFNVL